MNALASTHPHGKAESVFNFTEDHELEFNEDAIKELLNHPDVKNRQIVSFLTIGAFRKGKSFFLDYCLRYLYAMYPSIKNPNNILENKESWMGSPDEPLTGFSWCAGSTRDTSGILVWNDVFLHTDIKSGEKIAIIVMDTQGLFDNETTTNNNSKIFALSSLLSSIQVFNLKEVVQEDQLQYLQFATEYAKMASTTDFYTGTIFQNLMFLIRDWPHVTEFEFGIEGGKNYMKKFLSKNENQDDQIKIVRENIKSTFNKLSCALLPYPGPCVAGRLRSFYNGCWKEMELDFKEVLQNVIEYLLSPDRLVVKKVNGLVVNGTQFYDLIVNFFELFKSGILPKAHSILESTIERHMMSIVDDCFKIYKKKFSKSQGTENIFDRHEDFKKIALLKYQDAKKMGGQGCEIKYREILEKQIDEVFELIQSTKRTLEEEKEVAKRELEESKRQYEEQLQIERHANEERLRIEQKRSNMELEKYEQLRIVTEENLNKEREILRIRYDEFQKHQYYYNAILTALAHTATLVIAGYFCWPQILVILRSLQFTGTAAITTAFGSVLINIRNVFNNGDRQ